VSGGRSLHRLAFAASLLVLAPGVACSDCKQISIPDSVVVTMPVELAKSPVEICIDATCYAGTDSPPTDYDQAFLNGGVLELKLREHLPSESVSVRVSVGDTSDEIETTPIASHLRGEGCGSERSITLRFDATGELVDGAS
jgi:hypothetical protein